jgi:hypothetical protein
MDLLSAGDGGSRSWHSLLWHQWVAALRAEAAVLAHDPRRSPPPRRSKSARRSEVGPRPASGNRTPDRPADCAPSGRLRTPRDRCRDLPGSAARRTWRISSSSEAISANDGHAAITRPIRLGSATAILTARLATLLATRSAHGNAPPLRPDRESGQERGLRSDDHPVHRQRRQGGNPAWLPVQLHQPRCI